MSITDNFNQASNGDYTQEQREDAKIKLIHDMKVIAKSDRSFRFKVGEVAYTPWEMIKAIKNETELGKDYVTGYLDGLKFFEAARKTNAKTKWWRFGF